MHHSIKSLSLSVVFFIVPFSIRFASLKWFLSKTGFGSHPLANMAKGMIIILDSWILILPSAAQHQSGQKDFINIFSIQCQRNESKTNLMYLGRYLLLVGKLHSMQCIP